ncbi:MAG: DUF4296 domain-containing protein [Bacteroidota bacterium]
MINFTRVFTALIGLLFIFSCKEKLIEPPKDLISQAEMMEILYDLALINGLRSTNAAVFDKYDIETMPYLYEKYGIDSLQFVKSDAYYASVPVIYQTMYATVKNRLENRIKEMDQLRKQKTDSVRFKNQRFRDSLRKKTSSITLTDSVPSSK